MPHLEKLRLHGLVLPALHLAAQEDDDGGFLDHAASAARAGVVFDCRQIDPSFLDDTGAAAFAEGEALKHPVRLPFSECCFEFSDELVVVAYEEDEISGDMDEVPVSRAEELAKVIAEGNGKVLGYRSAPKNFGTYVEFFTFGTYPNGHVDGEEVFSPEPQEDYIREFADGITKAWGSFPNGADKSWSEDGTQFFTKCSADGDGENPFSHIDTERGAHRLLGVLTLLNEHLIATEIVPDQCRALNAKRASKGKLPLSAETRVLTINTAAVRRAVHGTALRQHETPRLHWRRGHWRTLHRYSEFESRTWVRRCLVGDPERGFIHKDYRLTWDQPMIQAGV